MIIDKPKNVQLSGKSLKKQYPIMILVIISKQLNGANLEASAYLSDNMRNKCPMQAKTPIEAIMDHCERLGLIHIKGITPETATSPTTPVNNKVNKGLSEVLNLRVIIK